MHCLDLFFEGVILSGQATFPVDILAIDPQSFGAHPLVAGLADYFNFFCKCIFKVNSPISRFSSSFSLLSLLYCKTDTTSSPVF